MRWMPPPSGISYGMMVPSEPNGGHIDDDDDQHAGDRSGEGQLPSLRNRSGWGVCGCPLFGKLDLRSFGGVFDRTCVRPLSVAFHDATGRYAVRKAGFTSVQRACRALEPRV